MVRPGAKRHKSRRVPALLLETVAAAEQELKSLKAVDIVENQTTRSFFTGGQAEGTEASVRIFSVKFEFDRCILAVGEGWYRYIYWDLFEDLQNEQNMGDDRVYEYIVEGIGRGGGDTK